MTVQAIGPRGGAQERVLKELIRRCETFDWRSSDEPKVEGVVGLGRTGDHGSPAVHAEVPGDDHGIGMAIAWPGRRTCGARLMAKTFRLGKRKKKVLYSLLRGRATRNAVAARLFSSPLFNSMAGAGGGLALVHRG